MPRTSIVSPDPATSAVAAARGAVITVESAQFFSSIVHLNNCIPGKNLRFWVTPDEFCNRLVHCGVHKSLSIEHVSEALRRYGKSDLFQRHPYSGIAYYRSTLVQDDRSLPLDQRWTISGRCGRMNNINPAKNCFVGNDEAQEHLRILNGALERLEEERAEEERQHREDMKMIVEEMKVEAERLGRSKKVQTEAPLKDLADDRTVAASTDFGIMKLSKMEDFIKAIATHSAQCGTGLADGECPVKLVKRDTSHGAGIIYVWKCLVCEEEMELRNCDWVLSICEPGRAFAKHQPEINLRLTRGAREVGINLYKLLHFVGGYVGVKFMTYRNLLHTDKKWRAAVRQLFGVRLDENREEHVKAARESPNYPGDIECTINGQLCSVCQASGAIDGAGPTRSFNNHHRGAQSGLINNSGLTKKPIGFEFDQASHFTKCYMCTKTLNEQLRASDEHIPVEEYANYSTEHKGTCYKNSGNNPASAEPSQATRAGQHLLLDDSGKYLGDDKASFLNKVYADNDASSPANFIRAQNDIIGTPSDNKAEHYPDSGHTFKLQNNDLFHLRDNEPAFRGKQLLSNERIASIHSDLRGAVLDYHEELGDPVARQRCVDQIHAIIPHHCGDHSGCKIEKFCTYLQVKNDKDRDEDWTEEQIRAEAARRSKRHGGRYMQLNEYGKQRLQQVIFKRFSLETIDRIAECGSSNSLHLVFCMCGGNEERTRQQLGGILNLVATSQELKTADTLGKKRKADYKRNNSEEGKRRRTQAKITKRFRMGKEDAKNAHRSGKVPLKRSAKSQQKKCRNCKMVTRHTPTMCPMPPPLKKRGPATQIDWYADESEVIGSRQPRKRRRKMFKEIDWSK